jgi:hypothetical protein
MFRDLTDLSTEKTIKNSLEEHLVVSIVEHNLGSIFQLEDEISRVEFRAGGNGVKGIQYQGLHLLRSRARHISVTSLTILVSIWAFVPSVTVEH